MAARDQDSRRGAATADRAPADAPEREAATPPPAAGAGGADGSGPEVPAGGADASTSAAGGPPAGATAAEPGEAMPASGDGDGTPPADAEPPAQAPASEAGDAPRADAGPSAQAPAGDAAVDAPADGELHARAERADEYLALAQRTQADFENFRRRMTRDVRAAEARGMGRLARELLPALDNLERALAAAEASTAGVDEHLTEGIRLVQAELSAALARAGIEGYAASGEPFDPTHHEAVAQHEVEGVESGTIVEVLQAGYRLGDSILRPARVVVAA